MNLSHLFHHRLLPRFLLAGLLMGGMANQAFAQMDHSAHMGMMDKPNTCQGSGLECANAATPFLTPDGRLYLAWTAGGVVSIAQSIDLGRTFSNPVQVAEHGKSLDAGGDARPQLVVNGQHIVLTYAFFKDKNWNAQINKVLSDDGGNTFSAPVSIVADTSSQRFPSMLQTPDGKIFLSWIDKRIVNASKGTDHELLGGSIAYSFSNDGGVHFNPEKIANQSSCECCRIASATDPRGGLAIAYRAIFPGGIRDHATQYVSEAESSGPVRRISDDGWKTDVCPHQGPSIAISSLGTFHVAWFTLGSKRQGVFYAKSHNQGASYSSPIRIGLEGQAISRPYLFASGQHIWLVWKQFDGHMSTIYLRESLDDGRTWLKDRQLSQTMGYSDHPLIIGDGQFIYLSWLTRAEGYQLIKIGAVP
jgi:hypothetical protein